MIIAPGTEFLTVPLAKAQNARRMPSPGPGLVSSRKRILAGSVRISARGISPALTRTLTPFPRAVDPAFTAGPD